MNIFQSDRPFWKGNLHCHSTMSDGAKSPEDVAAIYREHGYDFLAITDHRCITVPQARVEDSLLLIPGIELDYALPRETVHIVGINVTKDLPQKVCRDAGPQAGIDAIRACGGRAILAHPYWSRDSMETLLGFEGVAAAEVCNTGAFPRQDSSEILDLAATHGRLYRFVATDDAHSYERDACANYIMVQAQELTPQAVVHAIDEGRYYSTQGPRIEQITLTEEKITIHCSPASHICFHTNLAWSAGRIVSGRELAYAEYKLQPEKGDRYVRCQVIDEHGRCAWSNPFAL